MIVEHNKKNSYQLGGSLPFAAPTYVIRKADDELYQGLKAGLFCYVLNSRQMGKSSLRVRTMEKLHKQGIACCAIEVRDICSYDVTPDEFFGGFLTLLVSGFNLEFDVGEWWYKYEYIPPLLRLSRFIEEKLLVMIAQDIVVFVDEIDNILKLNFKDDFFAFVRSCYNKRAVDTKYNRLTFALLGVATPRDLIASSDSTPFNIDSRAIELCGFELEQAFPLEKGLEEVVCNPKAVLHEVLKWTQGQPFLTQWLCQLVCTYAHIPFETGDEKEWVAKIVRERIIKNWYAQDKQQHLQTIRERLLSDELRSCRLLGLYQQILQLGELQSDDSPEQLELRLSGLVVKQRNFLKVYNRIYESVFDKTWVKKELAFLRPYAEAIVTWEASSCHNSSYLLRGQDLRDAQAWAVSKSLSDLDYQFLTASLELEKQNIQTALNLEKEASLILSEANQTLNRAQKKAQRKINSGIRIFFIILVIAGIVAATLVKEAENYRKVIEVMEFNTTSLANNLKNKQLEALADSVKAANQISQIKAPSNINNRTQKQLKQVLFAIQENNQLQGHENNVLSICFNPDGKTIATASRDNTAKVWSSDGKLLKTLKGHQKQVYDVNFSPDGKKIATASADGTVRLWSSDGQLLQVLEGHSEAVHGVDFSPDGNKIATASADGTAKLWSSDGQFLHTLKVSDNWVYDVSFSPDGKTIATASADKTAKLWNTNGQFLQNIGKHEERVLSVSFSPNGNKIVTASMDKTVKLWKKNGQLFERDELENSIKHDSWIWDANFSPDGKKIATASRDGTAKLWSIDGRLLETFKGHNRWLYDVSFSPDSQTIATASADDTAKLWSKRDIGKIKIFLKGHDKLVYDANFSPNGKLIVTASADNTAKIWSPDGRLLHTLKHDSRVLKAKFSPDSRKIAIVSGDGKVELWNTNGKLLENSKISNDRKVNDLSFSPDGRKIATASWDGTVQLWSLEDGKFTKLKQFKEPSLDKADIQPLRAVEFSPDGKMIAAASMDGNVKFWYTNGKWNNQINAADDNFSIYDISFSPNGKTIVTGGSDAKAKLFDLNGQILKIFEGHSGDVLSVSFSPDGKSFATASSDSTIKIWNINDDKPVQTLAGNSGQFLSISFSPDGNNIAITNEDSSVIIWKLNVSLNELKETSCQLLKNYLYNQDRNYNLCP